MPCPKPLSPKTMERRMKESELSKKQLNFLESFFKACTNLYGTIELHEMWIIYNELDEKPKIKRRNLIDFVKIMRRRENPYYIYEISELDLKETNNDLYLTLVSGGTHGNLSALACARDHAKNLWKKEGKYPNGRPEDGYKLIISKDTHSSVRTIAKILDIEILIAEVDDQGSMSGEAVKKLLEEIEGVFAVVATTGTTNTGSIDDMKGISKICKEKIFGFM